MVLKNGKNIMPRHRGQYDPNNSEPYELSRSRIENYVRCPACFYMQQVEYINFPSIPGFLLNEATDVLLKKYFDRYRLSQEVPLFLKCHDLGHLYLLIMKISSYGPKVFNTVHQVECILLLKNII